MASTKNRSNTSSTCSKLPVAGSRGLRLHRQLPRRAATHHWRIRVQIELCLESNSREPVSNTHNQLNKPVPQWPPSNQVIKARAILEGHRRATRQRRMRTTEHRQLMPPQMVTTTIVRPMRASSLSTTLELHNALLIRAGGRSQKG